MYTAFAPPAAPRFDLEAWKSPSPPRSRDGFRHVAIEAISIPVGPREGIDAASLAELADNIRAVGVLQPVIVRFVDERRFELIAGERRTRAARLAGLSVVPAMVLHAPDANRDTVGLFENIHRQNLSQIEEARVLKRLLERNGSLERVARTTHKSKAWISERLQLLELGPTAAGLVVDGVTSDVDVINAVNRASRLSPARAEGLALDVRAAERKREVARRGLCAIRRELAAATSPVAADVDSRRNLGRLAAEIIRIGSSAADRSTREREMRQTLSCSDNACRERLQALLRSAFDLGRQASRNSASSLNSASEELLALLQGRPRLLQQLLVRSYSMALTTVAFDFQQISIG